MKKSFEIRKQPSVAARYWWVGLISLLLVVDIAAPSTGRTFSRISFHAKRVCSVAAGYWQTDQWREDMDTAIMEFEYLFFPESGAGARLDLETEE